MQRALTMYAWLARYSKPLSYPRKFLSVAFVGTHLPLIALLVFWLVHGSEFSALTVMGITLIATLVSTAATLTLLYCMLAPVLATSQALRRFHAEGVVPKFGYSWDCEVGQLMTDSQSTMEKLQQTVERLAHFDELTALPNRNFFRERLSDALTTAIGRGESGAVLLLDLDGFSTVNSLSGHAAGDDLLRSAAHRLRRMLQADDILARVGADEFAIVRTGVSNSEDLVRFSETLRGAVSAPLLLRGENHRPSASLGIALFPADASDADTLLEHAASALREAKRGGPDASQFFSREMNAELRRRTTIERELHLAVQRDEWEVYFQPKLQLRSGLHQSAEALVRWRHPTRGLIPPAEFIPVAEETNLIVPMGEAVLRKACLQARAWNASGLGPLRVAVNLSARQFRSPDLVQQVSRILDETRLDPSLLELEVTESMVMDDVQQSARILAELHDRGVALSLDDFGTGYSSLQYLRALPFDSLKIDRSFVNEVCTDNDAAAITRSIISLGHSLGMKVVAEGVETEEQLQFLREHGCDEIQGYLLSRPLEANHYERWATQRAAMAA